MYVTAGMGSPISSGMNFWSKGLSASAGAADPPSAKKKAIPNATRENPTVPEISFPQAPLTAEQRRALLAMRQWTPDERKIVARGLMGRMAIAIEPAAIALLFGFFTVGLVR